MFDLLPLAAADVEVAVVTAVVAVATPLVLPTIFCAKHIHQLHHRPQQHDGHANRQTLSDEGSLAIEEGSLINESVALKNAGSVESGGSELPEI